MKIIGMTVVTALLVVGSAAAADIVHDAEYYILEAQNGEKWAADDTTVDANSAEPSVDPDPIDPGPDPIDGYPEPIHRTTGTTS